MTIAELVKGKLSEVINWLRKYWKSERYIPLNPVSGINKYVQMTKEAMAAKRTKTDDELNDLYRLMIVRKGLRVPHTPEGDTYFERWKAWFDENMWPLLRENARWSFGLYEFYKDIGADSDGTIMFDYAAWTGDVATACLLAHGLYRNIDGDIVSIDVDDPISSYIEGSGCFKFIQYRSGKAQEAILRVKTANPNRKIKVGVFGGGADPTVWLNAFDLSAVELVIYDTNEKMKRVLEQILGQSLESLGIIFETVDFFEKFEDPELLGTFDIIIYNGVMSYYPDPEVKAKIIKGTWNLLIDGGTIFFEDIILCIDMLFAALVRCWKREDTGLTPEADLDSTIEKNKQILADAGFVDYQHDYLEVQNAPIDLVNWAIKKQSKK